MRVIDFISTGSEHTVYIIRSFVTKDIYWRGNRRDFVRELSFFFMFYSSVVHIFDVEFPSEIVLYI